MNRNFDVCVIGLGYIGLPTAVVLAQGGNNVVGVDINSDIVAATNAGQLRIQEPGLQDALRDALASQRLKATTTVPHSQVYLITVPTPFLDDHSCDPSFIFSAADSIAPNLRGGELIILESTSSPGMTHRLEERIKSARPELNDVLFAYCPERILPGKALDELRENSRIIGGTTPEASALAQEVYRTFCKGELLPTSALTAEMSKLTENAFRDINIAFANELSTLCTHLGVDVWELIRLANHHPRVNILQPGPGVGGHCIAVDPWFLISAAPQLTPLMRTARDVNDQRPSWVVTQVKDAIAERGLDDPQIVVLGLTYKANIDDLRESPSLDIVQILAEQFPQSQISAVVPNIQALPARIEDLPNVSLSPLDQALESSDVVVLLVEHKEFLQVNEEELQGKVVIDTKGVWRRPQA